MFGPPEDVEGECNARFRVADDYGDGIATFRCSLPPGHIGPHREDFSDMFKHKATITWEEVEDEEDEDIDFGEEDE